MKVPHTQLNVVNLENSLGEREGFQKTKCRNDDCDANFDM